MNSVIIGNMSKCYKRLTNNYWKPKKQKEFMKISSKLSIN